MIKLDLVVTAGGTATLVFELADKNGERLSNIASADVAVSLRQDSTPRTSHEVPQLVGVLDPATAVVTLPLGATETAALAPDIATTPTPVTVTCIGDVWVGGVDYYGPFTFTVRLPETYLGQATPVPVVSAPRYTYFLADDVTVPTEAQVLADGGATATRHPEPLDMPASIGDDAYFWLILPGPVTYWSVGAVDGVDQSGGLSLIQQADIDGVDHHWYRSIQLLHRLEDHLNYADYG